MAKLVSTPTENQRVRLIVADERWTSMSQQYLTPGEDGFERIELPGEGNMRRFSVQVLVDIEAARNFYAEGFTLHDPFVMDSDVLTEVEDARVSQIARAYSRFESRFNMSFLQGETEFLSNPQFFNFHNFFAKNTFGLTLLRNFLNTRGNAVYRSDKLKQRANQTLIEQTLFGSTPSNLGEIRSVWENLFALPMPVTQTKAEGIDRIASYYRGRKVGPTVGSVQRLVTGNGVMTNNNWNTRVPVISIRKHLVLPSNTTSGRPTAGQDGIVLVVLDTDAPIDQSPFLSLTDEPIRTNGLITPFLNPMTYRRIGISHSTMLTKNRRNRAPSVGSNRGGAIGIQTKTPIVNSMEKTREFPEPILRNTTPIPKNFGPVLQLTRGNQNLRLR